MDTVALTTIASTVVSLLVPYLKKLGDELAKKAGEQIGRDAGEMVWKKTQHLYDKIKDKFSKKPTAQEALDDLQSSPDDVDTQAAVRVQLKKIMSTDEDFARELAFVIKEASDAGADTVFQTTIAGNVQKLVQMGTVYGDVKI